MSTHGADGTSTRLPDVVPFDLASLGRLSSELGSRVVTDENVTLRNEWEHAASRWKLTVFEVTDNTVVMRLGTPVGRQRFYGAAQMDFESVRPQLEAADDWRRVSAPARH